MENIWFGHQNNLAVAADSAGVGGWGGGGVVLAAGGHCDDALDQEHFPHVFLLHCHILKNSVRSHPDERASENLRPVVRSFSSFQKLFRGL